MGFMDKAKKMAEQAQTKLDEVQKQFNESQAQGASAPGGPATEYDAHGRPVGQTEPVAAPAGPSPAEEGIPPTPPQAATEPPAAETPAPPSAPAAPAPAAGPSGDLGAAPAAGEGDGDDYAPPKLSSGDPLG